MLNLSILLAAQDVTGFILKQLNFTVARISTDEIRPPPLFAPEKRRVEASPNPCSHLPILLVCCENISGYFMREPPTNYLRRLRNQLIVCISMGSATIPNHVDGSRNHCRNQRIRSRFLNQESRFLLLFL